ncbi:MAG: phosphoadenylyl-sulfate reductase [Balneolales bacterium]
MTNFDSHKTNPVSEVQELNRQYENTDVETILSRNWEQYGKEMVIGTGFGASGAVLMHKLYHLELPVTVFYLDTNLLFRQTYELRDDYAEKYKINFERVETDLSVDKQAEKYGEKLWNKSPDQCCHIRKVLPLKHYLTDKQVWVTGVRRDQSASRKNTAVFEWDKQNEVIKINPLASWDADDIWSYIKFYDLPYNPLHDHGYPSIGCQPCTKPTTDSDNERSGRWSGQEKTECGIHLVTQESSEGS